MTSEMAVGYSVDRLSALAREMAPLMIGFCGMHALLYMATQKVTGGWRVNGTSGAAAVAYNLTTLLFHVASCSAGVRALGDGSMASLSGSMPLRLYGSSLTFMWLSSLTAGFEAYNTFVSVFVCPQGLALAAHHVVTLSLCFVSVAPYAHYYAFFFFGIANLSSVPLAIFSLCDVLRSRYGRFEASYYFFRSLFGVSFLVVRCAVWPIMSAYFWVDTLAAFQDGTVHSTFATCFLLASNVFLTGLQFMWGRKVVRGFLMLISSLYVTHEPAGCAAKDNDRRRSGTSVMLRTLSTSLAVAMGK